MLEIVIKLNPANGVVTGTKDVVTVDPEGVETTTTVDVIDWQPALIAAATEIQAMNAYAGTELFPEPVQSNPASETLEGYIGTANTPPIDNGMVTVKIENYNWMDLTLLPATPTTFTFVLGIPPQVGKFI